MLFAGNLNTAKGWELVRTVKFNKEHFQKVQGKVMVWSFCWVFLKSSLKSAIWIRFATKQTVILEMERPLSVRRRLFCNFASDLPEKNSSPPLPDKELALQIPHEEQQARGDDAALPQFPTLKLSSVKNPFY